MALTEAGIAAIGTAASAIGSTAINAANVSATNRKSYKYTSKLAQEAFDRNVQQWQIENAYNSPQAQMQRYKLAGINPNVIYGNSQQVSSGNTTSSPARYTPSQFKAQAPMDVAPSLNAATTFGAAYASNALTQANTIKALAEAKAAAQKGNLSDSQRKQIETLTGLQAQNIIADTDVKIKQLSSMQALIDNTNADTATKSITNQFLGDLMQAQIRSYNVKSDLDIMETREAASRINLNNANVKLVIADIAKTYKDIEYTAHQIVNIDSLTQNNIAQLRVINANVDEINERIANIAAETKLTTKQVNWFVYDQVLKGIDVGGRAFNNVMSGIKPFGSSPASAVGSFVTDYSR